MTAPRAPQFRRALKAAKEMEAAMESIGMDVHKMNSQVCVVGKDGEIIEERRVRTDRERFAAVLGKRPKARC
jgi:hypothetical protein